MLPPVYSAWIIELALSSDESCICSLILGSVNDGVLDNG